MLWNGGTVQAYVNINIYVVLKIMQKKENKSEYHIIQIIFKCCESEMYLIVILPNYKRT